MRKGDDETSPHIIVLRPSWLNYSKNFVWTLVLIVGALICLDDLEAMGVVLLLIVSIILLHAILKRK